MKKYNYKTAAEASLFTLIPVCLLLMTCLNSCQKFLDAKPNQAIATPATIEDLEGILNSYSFINGRYPSASEVASDDFYLTTADFNSLFDAQRFYYSWQKSPNFVGDYNAPYNAVEYVNILLETLPKIPGDIVRKEVIRGNALFVRASYHYALSQLYAKAYNPTSAATDLGIALRWTSDISVRPFRSTISETYSSVINDLQKAVALLPQTPGVKYRASKPAAYGMLARVYLSMSDYKNAGLYADSALALYNTLINYNTLNPAATIPFKQFNDEVIYDSKASGPQALGQAKARVDTMLYSFYDANDLRKAVFFKKNTNGSMAFKGNYTGVTGTSLFTGIATNELYLIKAETAARNGDTDKALSTLNSLLLTRWKTGTFIPYSTHDPKGLLDAILKERRKDLLFRTLRWTDLRRLNMEPGREITLTRKLNGTNFSLEPNSLRYVFQIDQKAIDISGLQQNP